MDANQFREFGKAAVDFIADYLENIRDRDVLPSVSPGYLHELLPNEMPEKSEDWKTVLSDVERVIMPGVTHWQSPNFHAYYPTATSFPSIVGEMMAAGMGVIGFSWICSPACTELEVVVMDWVAKFLNLPKVFLNSSEGNGGGVIQGSASEAILVAVLAAREQVTKKFLKEHPELSESDIRGRLIAYSSDQSNSCVEKAGLLAAVPIKLIPANEDLALTGDALQKAIDEDTANGKIPIICIATMGTTGTCAYDDLVSLAPVCEKHGIWLHLDAAYAGAVLALPELHHLGAGIEHVDSLNFNLHKVMKVNFDCCAMWLKNAELIVDSFNVDRVYLKHNFEGQSKAPDYRHWQIPLGRRFRALKVWITLRTLGMEEIRKHLRNHVTLAKRFEDYVRRDPRFEVVAKQTFGLVCFRVRGDDELSKTLLDRVNERKKIYIIQAAHKGRHFLRFAVCGHDPQEKDIDFAWNEIREQADLILPPIQNGKETSDEQVIEKITEKFSNGICVATGKEKAK